MNISHWRLCGLQENAQVMACRRLSLMRGWECDHQELLSFLGDNLPCFLEIMLKDMNFMDSFKYMKYSDLENIKGDVLKIEYSAE